MVKVKVKGNKNGEYDVKRSNISIRFLIDEILNSKSYNAQIRKNWLSVKLNGKTIEDLDHTIVNDGANLEISSQ